MNALKLALLVLGAAPRYMAEAGTAGTETEEAKARFCEVEYDNEGEGSVIFNFGNGKSLQLGVGELNAEMKQRSLLHGINQKVRDSFAGVKGDYAKGVENAQDIIDQLKAGSWKAARGEGESRPRVEELAAAIAALKGIDFETAKKAATEASDEKRKEWRNHPRIKAAIAKLRLEKAEAELAASEKEKPGAEITL